MVQMKPPERNGIGEGSGSSLALFDLKDTIYPLAGERFDPVIRPADLHTVQALYGAQAKMKDRGAAGEITGSRRYLPDPDLLAGANRHLCAIRKTIGWRSAQAQFDPVTDRR